MINIVIATIRLSDRNSVQQKMMMGLLETVMILETMMRREKKLPYKT